jgi:hypothetical protein
VVKVTFGRDCVIINWEVSSICVLVTHVLNDAIIDEIVIMTSVVVTVG